MDHLAQIQPSPSSRNSSPAGSNYSESSVNIAKPAADKGKAGKRKGTRSVSTLTPSQLARKRANDREAQRAIRARTKEHIENLEREIDELRSQQSRDQTVRDLLGKNRALEIEVRRLRESLGIRSAGPGVPYPNSYTSSGSQPSPYDNSTPEYPMVSDLPPYSHVHDTTNVWPASVPCSLPSTVSSPSSPAAPDDYGSNYFSNNTSAILDRSSIPPAMNSPAASCITNGDISFDDVKSATSRAWMPTADQHRTNLSNIPAATVERIPSLLLSVPGGNLARNSSLSYWEIPVVTSSTSCQEDALISGYVADCRRLTDLARGQPHPEVILGPHHPNIKPLLLAHGHLLDSLGLQGPQTGPSHNYPLVDIMMTIFDANRLELPLERVGSFLLFRALIAWMVQPTRDNYAVLRDVLPPQPSQLTIPHPQWMDFILWPLLRNVVIERHGIYNTPEFRHFYCTNLRLRNWPLAITEAFTVDFSTGSVYVTNEFSEYVWDLRNWGMHGNFTQRYPELGACLGHSWSA